VRARRRPDQRHRHGDHRWREDAHLLAIPVLAFSLGRHGYRARRRRRPGCAPHHVIGTGGSYIALLTGFYVDNGPSCHCGTGYPTSPAGCHRALSAYPSSGSRFIAFSATRAPTRPATDLDQPRVDSPLLGGAYRKAAATSRITEMQVTVWYFADCPNWRVGVQRLRQALAVIGRGDADVRLVPVATEVEAAAVGFAGSPTYTVDHVDLFGPVPSVGALTCRVYRTPSGFAGVPEVDDLVAALAEKVMS
jgi:hypothetical protein